MNVAAAERPNLHALSGRLNKLREKYGLLNWTKRNGSKAIEEALQSILPAECFDVNVNSSRPLGRDLTTEERLQIKAGMGQMLQRGRTQTSN